MAVKVQNQTMKSMGSFEGNVKKWAEGYRKYGPTSFLKLPFWMF